MNDDYDDYDYTPRPRNYAKCDKCSDDYVMRHHCKPTSRIRTWIRQLLRRIADRLIRRGGIWN